MVERQLQALRDPGELPPPIVQLRGEPFAGQPFALPDRKVRVLDGQLRQRRRCPLTERAVQGRQLVEQDAHRPAVRNDVVQIHQQRVLPRGDAEQGGADERSPGEVERTPRFVARKPRQLPPSEILRQPLQIDQRNLEGRRRCDHLDGAVLTGLERGAQRLLAADDLAEGSAQGVQVEHAGQAHGAEHVVERVVRRQAVEEPQALLGERERQVAVPGHRQDGRRLRVLPPEFAVDARRERGDRRRLEERAQRQLYSEGVAHPRHHLCREERVASQGEEVVLGADPLQSAPLAAEHLVPDLRQHLFDRSLRRQETRHRFCQRTHRGRRHLRERAAVDLAVGVERQAREDREGRRDHRLREPAGEPAPKVVRSVG